MEDAAQRIELAQPALRQVEARLLKQAFERGGPVVGHGGVALDLAFEVHGGVQHLLVGHLEVEKLLGRQRFHGAACWRRGRGCGRAAAPSRSSA